MLLADLGADVIKVEQPGEGDETRSWGPPFADGESAYFLAVNRGKRSVALDLTRPEAKEALRRLAGRADVVIENFRAGTAERLGAGYEQLGAENPKLVYCSISGFGDDRPGYDFILQAESGLMAITGEADGAPSKVGVAVVDVLAGYACATAILGALVEGGGKRVEVSLYDVALSALTNVAQGALVTGKEPARHGNAHPNIVPYETFATADGELAVAAANDGLFARLCEALERPDLLRFATNPERVERREELTAKLSAIFATATADEWVERLREAGVPAGKVRGVLEALADARTVSVEHPTIGPRRPGRSPLGPPAEPAPPPLRGQHTREVLEELGYDGERLEALLLPSS